MTSENSNNRMRKLVTLNVSHPEADVRFATIMVPPPNSAERYFPTVTDFN